MRIIPDNRTVRSMGRRIKGEVAPRGAKKREGFGAGELKVRRLTKT